METTFWKIMRYRLDRMFAKTFRIFSLPSRVTSAFGLVFLRLGFITTAALLLRNALFASGRKPPLAIPDNGYKRANKSVKLSVIIPTYNRAESLDRCLKSLESQAFDNDLYEVIVVNNSCTDNTGEICASYARRFKRLFVVHEPVPGLLPGRHAGFRSACGDILVFCDDDIEAPPNWLTCIDDAFASDQMIALVGGNIIPVFETPPPDWMDELWIEIGGIRYNDRYSLIEGVTSFREAPVPTLVFGCNYSVRRSFLEKVGGFEPDLMEHVLFQGGGESGIIDLIVRLGGRVYLHPGVTIRHHMPTSRLSEEYMYKRGAFVGVSDLFSYFRSGKGLPPIRMPHSTLKNPGLEQFENAYHKTQISYINAVYASPELRAWITRQTYFGHEEPPKTALSECSGLSERFSW